MTKGGVRAAAVRYVASHVAAVAGSVRRGCCSRAEPAVNDRRVVLSAEREPRRWVRVAGAVGTRALGGRWTGGAAGGHGAALVGRHRVRRRPAPHSRHLAARRAPGPAPGQGGFPVS